MFKVLFFGLFVSVAIASHPVKNSCDCDLLKPLYKSLECQGHCRRGPCYTNYDCSKSPYLLNLSKDRCWFQGKPYAVGATLPGKYPDQYGVRMCQFVCRMSSFGTYLSPCNCDIISTPLTDGCPYDIMYNSDYIFSHLVPVYDLTQTQILHCPVSWVKPQYLNYTTVLCIKNSKRCCNYGDIKIAKYDSFTLPYSNIICTCMCPPYIQCILDKKKDSW